MGGGARTTRETTAVSVSPWLASIEETAPALAGDIDVDVVIIGGGYTGLCSALALREEGARVAVLEAGFCGFGASGRNAGHLTPTIGKDLATLQALFRRDTVERMVHLAETAISEVEDLIQRHAIACDYEPVGNVVAAVHPKQFRAIDRAAAAAQAFGLPGEVLEEAEMRRRGLPAAFVRGYHERHGGVLDPGRYVRGLRRAALERGVALFEGTAVTVIEDGDRPAALTRGGRAVGRHLVVAVNGYGHDLLLPRPIPARVMPIYVQLLQTAPLTDAQLARVGWRGREGVYTAHEVLESWRLTGDNRIVGGSKHIRYGYGGGVLPDRDASVTIRLEATLRRRFPELAEVEVSSVWGGRIALALDFLPAVGRTGRSGNILYSLSYAGHGLAMASYAGRMVADLVARRDGPGSALWNRRGVPIPPEPLRWLVFRALNGFFEGIDRRVDRAIE